MHVQILSVHCILGNGIQLCVSLKASSRMFYINKGRKIQINNTRPRNLSAGGWIKDDKKTPYKDEDSISSNLEYGSLVIPKRVMESGVMKLYKGPTTGPKQTDPHELGKTIVMGHEYVVHKRYAGRVEKFLAKHGITLPLKSDKPIKKFF